MQDLVNWKHYQFTLHLFKDQPEDGPTIGPKNVAAIII